MEKTETMDFVRFDGSHKRLENLIKLFGGQIIIKAKWLTKESYELFLHFVPNKTELKLLRGMLFKRDYNDNIVCNWQSKGVEKSESWKV